MWKQRINSEVTEKVGDDRKNKTETWISPPTFSVRPRSSVGRVTVDLIRRSWVRFPPRSKDFFFTSCGSLIPFTRANAQWVIHGLISTLIYTSELILCFHICVLSATRHNIHLFDYSFPVLIRGQTMNIC